jgi:hypothetical protein
MHVGVNTMSATIIIVEKNGDLKETSFRSENINDLYKKAGFKTATGFTIHSVWNVELSNKKQYNIVLYGKTTGRANQENKYEFPPPVDNTLFFGNCVLANISDGVITNLSVDEWEEIYNYLYGGFEDIGDDDEDEDDDDEEEIDANVPLTKTGYVKDDFVVEDDEEDDSIEHIPLCNTKKNTGKTVRKKRTKVVEPQIVNNWTKNDEPANDCMSELSEEEYV